MELHIEQGPILDREQIPIGIVNAITGLTWYEITIQGEVNYAGTTPTLMRHDAGLTAARIITFPREIAISLGENQRATCVAISFSPNAINVIPDKAILSVDLRNSDKTLLRGTEHQLLKFLRKCVRQDGVHIDIRLLAHISQNPVTQMFLQP